MGCVQSLFAVDLDLSQEYELRKPLGRGVEGEVWLGVHKITGAQVAIKLVQRCVKCRARASKYCASKLAITA